jgi:hypothetical protein
VKKAAAKEKSRRILGLLSSGEGRAFLAKVLQKGTDAKRQKKEGLEKFFQNRMPSIFV